MSSRISTDLGDPTLLRLLKLEAKETGTSMKAVLQTALRSYFTHRLETRALERAAESIFTEWLDPRDAEYDAL